MINIYLLLTSDRWASIIDFNIYNSHGESIYLPYSRLLKYYLDYLHTLSHNYCHIGNIQSTINSIFKYVCEKTNLSVSNTKLYISNRCDVPICIFSLVKCIMYVLLLYTFHFAAPLVYYI